MDVGGIRFIICDAGRDFLGIWGITWVFKRGIDVILGGTRGVVWDVWDFTKGGDGVIVGMGVVNGATGCIRGVI